MTKKEITDTTILKPGDRIELHYKFMGPDWTWWRASQYAMIESRLGKNETFSVKSITLDDAKAELVFVVDIKKPDTAQTANVQEAGLVSTAAVIAALSVVVGGMVWLSLDKIYQLTESPAGAIAVAGGGVFIAALGIAAVLYFLTKLKGLKNVAA